MPICSAEPPNLRQAPRLRNIADCSQIFSPRGPHTSCFNFLFHRARNPPGFHVVEYRPVPGVLINFLRILFVRLRLEVITAWEIAWIRLCLRKDECSCSIVNRPGRPNLAKSMRPPLHATHAAVMCKLS